jgi:hypothetical protein
MSCLTYTLQLQVGLDLSQDMVRYAQRKAQANNRIKGSVTVVQVSIVPVFSGRYRPVLQYLLAVYQSRCSYDAGAPYVDNVHPACPGHPELHRLHIPANLNPCTFVLDFETMKYCPVL